MSLDVYLRFKSLTGAEAYVYSANITHNLGSMASEAGIYECMWRPDEIGLTRAHELIQPLTTGLKLLKSDPERFKAFDSPNGWGTYKHFVPFVEKYLAACCEFPLGVIEISR